MDEVGEYTELAWSIANEQLLASAIKQRLTEIGKDHKIKEVMDKWFDPTDAYNGRTEELRYFFYRYDEYLARKAGHQINESQWNKIWADDPSKSVEHIKPQKSGVSYMHHLGNLMMLPPGVNSRLQDNDLGEH